MRAIQVGVSRFGKTWRLGLEENADVEVVGLVDINREELEQARSHFGLPAERCFTDPYASWESFPDADFVVISTPHAAHYDSCLRAIRRGMDVIVVKPLSDVFANALTVVREADRLGRKVVVAQQLRFHEACLALRQQVPRVGEIAYVAIDAFFGRTGPVRDKWWQPHPMLLEAAIHHFDLFRWITGLDASSVVSDTWNMPWNDDAWGVKSACCLFRAENDARFVFRGLATDQPSSSYPGSWVIEGTDGVLRLEEGRVYLNDEEVWPIGADVATGLDLPRLNAEVLRQAVGYFGGTAETSLTGADNLRSLAMVFGAVQSGAAGNRVDIAALVEG